MKAIRVLGAHSPGLLRFNTFPNTGASRRQCSYTSDCHSPPRSAWSLAPSSPTPCRPSAPAGSGCRSSSAPRPYSPRCCSPPGWGLSAAIIPQLRLARLPLRPQLTVGIADRLHQIPRRPSLRQRHAPQPPLGAIDSRLRHAAWHAHRRLLICIIIPIRVRVRHPSGRLAPPAQSATRVVRPGVTPLDRLVRSAGKALGRKLMPFHRK